MDRDLVLLAAELRPLYISTLDAIHMAAALTAGEELAGTVTYDARMALAARDLGLAAIAPAAPAPA